jgi:hypothetical protein
LARLLGSSDLADVGAVALAICQSHLDVSAELEVYQGEEEAAAASEDEDEEATEDAGAATNTTTDSEDSHSQTTEDVNHVALGFILTDRLPGGRVIRAFWDHSPFEALRRAPPLGSSIEQRIQYTIEEFLEPLTTLQVPIIATALVALAAAFLGYAIGRG